MTLARVGSGAGPDLERLAALRKAGGDRAIYAAGGVRDAADLAALDRAGIAGALVATALHDGRIGRAELDQLEQRNAEGIAGVESRSAHHG
jgi:phosphoribosylformimino-5-aminoimidazole carboxamide ribotide isomerase